MEYVFVILLITTLTVISGHIPKTATNQCTLHQNGCEYQLVLKGSDCMSRDDPMYGAGFTTDENDLLGLSNTIETVAGKEDESIKRLEQLDKKMTKMMEGLSVRSLRHIRQIRNDLRQMSSTMNTLKQQSGTRKNKRGLSSSCPPEFVGVGTWSSCYRFSNFNATWHEAREYCNAFGADLVALDTLKESYILDYLIKSNPELMLPKGWWTGGNYVPRQRRWMWTSIYQLLPMKTSRWAPGEPNARSTMHCLLLYKFANYQWHDGTCTDKHNFICELEMQQ